ncbi:hypothetical protein ACF0H5_011967 [Mactra antiquata]
MDFKMFTVVALVCLCCTMRVNCIGEVIKDAVDESNDLFVEPIQDMANNAIDNMGEAVSNTVEMASEISEKMLDPYEEVMEMFKVPKMEDFTEDVLDTMIDKLTNSFHCNSGIRKRSTTCTHALCFNTTNLMSMFGRGLTYVSNDAFENISTMVLYYITNLNRYCHAEIELDDYVEFESQKDELVIKFSGGMSGFFNLENIQESLEEMREIYGDYKDHLEDGHVDDDNHEMETEGFENGNDRLDLSDLLGDDFDSSLIDGALDMDHSHDHSHTNDGHAHRKKRGTEDGHEVTGDKSKEVFDDHHTDDGHIHDIVMPHPHDDQHDDDTHDHSEEVDDHDDHSDDEDDDDSHEHDDDDDDDDETRLIKRNCISADILYDQLGYDVDDSVDRRSINSLSSLIVYHLLIGSEISNFCRLLPRKNYFAKSVYRQLASSDVMEKEDFLELLTKLEIGQASQMMMPDVHDHGHGHVHRRKRAVVLEPEIWSNRCYTGDQLLSVFNSQQSNITLEKFKEICPSLIQQQLSESCKDARRHDDHDDDDGHPTDAERYGYGTLANILCCLCSLAGVIVLPCARKSVYRVLMATFVGLGVSTLSSDALLHLLPMALGVHGHEDGHDHGESTGKPHFEPFVGYALASLAGIYAFYLFEKLMSMFNNSKPKPDDDDPVEMVMGYNLNCNQNKQISNGNGYGSNATLPSYENGDRISENKTKNKSFLGKFYV